MSFKCLVLHINFGCTTYSCRGFLFYTQGSDVISCFYQWFMNSNQSSLLSQVTCNSKIIDLEFLLYCATDLIIRNGVQIILKLRGLKQLKIKYFYTYYCSGLPCHPNNPAMITLIITPECGEIRTLSTKTFMG